MRWSALVLCDPCIKVLRSSQRSRHRDASNRLGGLGCGSRRAASVEAVVDPEVRSSPDEMVIRSGLSRGDPLLRTAAVILPNFGRPFGVNISPDQRPLGVPL